MATNEVARLELAPPPSPTDEHIYSAIAKAQSEIKNPPLDTTNPHYKSRFASLAAVRNAIIPAFTRHGLSVMQDVRTTERGASVTTHVLHSSGGMMTFGPLEIPAQKADAQGIGSAESYARRYALLAMACISGEDDDDGEAAVGPARITETQVAELDALITEVGADREKFLRFIKAKSLGEIRATAFEQCKRQLEAKRR